MNNLDRPTVKRVRQVLIDSGFDDSVIELEDTARSASDAATSVGCDLGAIVKSLVFAIDNRFIMALVAGDHQCNERQLPNILKMNGEVRRPQASEVKGITGFTIGGVAPIGMAHRIPTVVDGSFRRFETIYAAAGHPYCVFPTTFDDLVGLTDGIVSYVVATPVDPANAFRPALRRSKTFSDVTTD